MRLDEDRRAVAQNFRHALHDFRRVVTQADDGVGAQLFGMPLAQLHRIFARLFAEVGQDGDVAADQRLQSCADRSENRSRANDDAAHDAEIFHNPITIKFEGRSNPGGVHTTDNLMTSVTLAPAFV